MGHHAHDAEAVRFGVVTISSSRSLESDASGDAIVKALEAEGHSVTVRDLVVDDESAISERIGELLQQDDVDAVITSGGTGMTPDDVTVEAIEPLLDRKIPGFGERFRAKSVGVVGLHGMLTRAMAGVGNGTPVFCLPGSEQAATFGTEELIVPVVGHVVSLAAGGNNGGHDHKHNHNHEHDEDGTDEVEQSDLTHTDGEGSAQMVNVGEKANTRRQAKATGRIQLQPSTVEAIRKNNHKKGDVLATARVGTIQAVKHTWETIPMCHQIPITNVETDFDVGEESVTLTVTVETVGKTGCEMEALEGVTTGLNVVWDMVKAAEKTNDGNYPTTAIGDVRVVEKVKESL